MRRDDYTVFCEKFEPIGEEEGSMKRFHWEGDDWIFIQEIEMDKGVNYIWTLLDCDGKMYISPGIHRVNRMDYIVTKKPWNEKTRDYKY